MKHADLLENLTKEYQERLKRAIKTQNKAKEERKA